VVATALLVASCGGGGGDAGAKFSATTASACTDSSVAGYLHVSEPINSVRQIYDGTLTPDLAVSTYRNIDRLFPTRIIARSGPVSALPRAASQLADVIFLANGQAYGLEDFLTLNRVAGLLVLKNGKIVHETCRYGNVSQTRWMSMSVAKSVTSTLIGAAVKEATSAASTTRWSITCRALSEARTTG